MVASSSADDLIFVWSVSINQLVNCHIRSPAFLGHQTTLARLEYRSPQKNLCLELLEIHILFPFKN
jgi:hypothetical protein